MLSHVCDNLVWWRMEKSYMLLQEQREEVSASSPNARACRMVSRSRLKGEMVPKQSCSSAIVAYRAGPSGLGLWGWGVSTATSFQSLHFWKHQSGETK